MRDEPQRSQLYVEPQMPLRWDLSIIAATILSLVLVVSDALFDFGSYVFIAVFWIDNAACVCEDAISMLDESCSVIGLARGHQNLLNPAPDSVIEHGDDAFVISREPPR